MKVKAKIISISEKAEGKSATTGKPWTSRNVLLTFEDETGQSYINAQISEDVYLGLGLREGLETELNLKFRTNRWRSGYVETTVRIIDPANAQ